MSEYIFKLPDLGEGTVEAEIAEWMVKSGDVVHEEDTICSMLTDKAAVELTAPVSGRVVSLAGEVGDSIAVGSPLIVFDSQARADEGSAQPSQQPPREPASAGVSAEEIPQPGETFEAPAVHGRVKTSPSIRQRAREANIDLTQVPATGPRGRILKSDFEGFLENRGQKSATAPRQEARARATGSTEIKVVGLRRKIAQHMEESNRDIPHFAYVEEIDVTALEELRQHLNSRKRTDQDPLTFLPFIALALVKALEEFPQCNAHYDKERNVLIRHHAVHLGIATQTADGLKVPVVRHAESRGLEDMALEIRRVSQAARDNSASREELSGSTITLTSLGKLGGIVSTPIINSPEVAIIGVNKALERAVVHKGRLDSRLMMNLSSSFDHRFVDGYDAANMIQALRQMLEQPATIFI